MTIDINKIQIGDEVTVKGVVCGRGYGDHPLGVSIAGGGYIWTQIASVATHTPKPREFKPGDMVTWGTGISAMRGEIIALDCEMAFIKFGGHYDAVHTCALRHADPAPAPQDTSVAKRLPLHAERFWMVAGNGPTSTRHRTKEKAESEARRLSAKQPGTKFFVLEAVGAVSTSAVEQPVEIVEPESHNEHGRDIQF